MNTKSKNRTLDRIILNDPDILIFTKNEQKNVLCGVVCPGMFADFCPGIATMVGGDSNDCILYCYDAVYSFPEGYSCSSVNHTYCYDAGTCGGSCY